DTLTATLSQLRTDLQAIVVAGIDSVSAARLLERAVARPGVLPDGHLRVLAAGKAAHALAGAAARLFGSRIRSGLVVSNVAGPPPPPFAFIQGAHPVPSAESERGGRRALELAASVRLDETLIVLLSGGGSAILAVPADGIVLDDKRRATDRLLKAGADIHALNTVRKHLSAIKGGWLATGGRGTCRALVVSDVVGDDPSFIASGPTVADASRFQDALDVLARCDGEAVYPPAVVARLRRGAAG